MIDIRAAKIQDAAALSDIYNPYVLSTTISYETKSVTKEEFQGRMEGIMKGYPYLVAQEDEVIIGFAYAGSFRTRDAYEWDAELSIYVDESCRGRGIGTMFMEKLLAVLKGMNFVNVYSLIDYPNDGSMALHNRFGFTRAGMLKGTGYKLGRWLDTVILEKRINVGEPKPINRDWRKLL